MLLSPKIGLHGGVWLLPKSSRHWSTSEASALADAKMHCHTSALSIGCVFAASTSMHMAALSGDAGGGKVIIGSSIGEAGPGMGAEFILCIDMCADMCANMCGVQACLDMCADISQDVGTDMCRHAA